MYTIQNLFDLSHTLSAKYLADFTYPWEALQGISDLIVSLGARLDPAEYTQVSPQVWIHNTAKVAPSACLGNPCIIGANTEVRHCAFIRGSALIGENCVIGNSVELKNVIIFDRAEVPHFNYVGDSILGYRAHMGAGSITSNIKSDRTPITVKTPEGGIATGMRKIGAMLGDHVEVGCNSVLNPGTVIGRNCIIYPLSCVRGVIPADSIVKTGGIIVAKE